MIGVAEPIKGEVPALLVLKAGVSKEATAIVADAMALVRETIGPVAAFGTV